MIRPRPALDNIKEYQPGENPKEETAIKLASNENPLGPSPKAIAEIKKNIKNLNIYPDQYSKKLINALAKKLAMAQDNIVIGNGSDEVMGFIAAAYLSAGDEVIISRNTFSTYEFVTRLMDANPVFVDTKDYGYDLPQIAAKSTARTKLIFLCNPNSPTGRMFSAAELEAFLEDIPQEYIVIIDEAYYEYTEAESYPDTIKHVKQGKNVIVLRTFSKIYGLAGLRCGYGVAKPETIKYLRAVKLPFNVNRLAAAGAAAALEDGEHVKKSRENNRAGKKFFYEELSSMSGRLSYLETEANFICINLKQPADPVFLKLMSEGVIIRPLTSFGMPDSIRVTIGTPEQNKKFVTALRKVL